MGIIADLAALARAGMKVDDIKDIINLTKDKPDDKPDDKPEDKPEDKPDDKTKDKTEDKTKDKTEDKTEDKTKDKTDYKKLYEETKEKLNKAQADNLKKDTQPKPKDADTIISDLVRNFM